MFMYDCVDLAGTWRMCPRELSRRPDLRYFACQVVLLLQPRYLLSDRE